MTDKTATPNATLWTLAMKGQLYHMVGDMYEWAKDGLWVSHEDHLRVREHLDNEVTALRAQLEQVTKERDTLSDTVTELTEMLERGELHDSAWNEAIAAAAKVCKELERKFEKSGQAPGPLANLFMSEGCASCYVAIRSLKRGEKP